MLLYFLARSVVALIQALPLPVVARVGRFGGIIVWAFDRRHRRVALRNLTMCFGNEKSAAELRALTRENFRRIGENFACAAKTASMSFEEIRDRVEFVADARILNPNPPSSNEFPVTSNQNPVSNDQNPVSSIQSPSSTIHPPSSPPPQSIVAAIGHFGNFELYARFRQFMPAYKCATTYRALRQPRLNQLLQSLRERSGCTFFERRFDAEPLRDFMSQAGVMLGLLSDQHSGKKGLRIPFLGHECSTSPAPALFALRYRCALYTGICYRIGLARWRIEGGDEIPTRVNGQARSLQAIMTDVNRAFEAAVRRDPANWFWVHNRWKAVAVQSPMPKVQSPPATEIQIPTAQLAQPASPESEQTISNPS